MSRHIHVETVKSRHRVLYEVALLCAVARAVAAQVPSSPRFLDVGSEREQVLRVLQLTGDAPLYPWSVRELAPSELDRLSTGSARGRGLLPPESTMWTVGALRGEFLPLTTNVIYNSAFPFSLNDGPVWAGRGVTASLSAGVAGRIGPLSFQLEPVVFDAQNRGFILKPNGLAAEPYMDGFYPGEIDLPQRFGDKPYHRFDLGQSSVRLDLGPVMAELSTANQWWGPAIDSPIILGNNAAGFPHGVLGTSHPISIWIGQIHGRVVWGRLDQSDYSPDHGADSIRFMSGLVGVFTPRGIPGLELGATRFFHTQWPTDGLRHATFSRPFEGILKGKAPSAIDANGNTADNQLASLFFRWTLPDAGVEIYGEFGREDHNIDQRDLILEGDHDAAYMIGLQRAWKRGNTGVVVARTELLNSRLSHLDQGRAQAPWYVHDGTVTQGHTNDGQLLGAPFGFGGGAAGLAVDSYDPSGRWTFAWNRMLRAQSQVSVRPPVPLNADVIHAFSIERRRTMRSASITLGGRAMWDLNRDFSRDRFNLNANLRIEKAF